MVMSSFNEGNVVRADNGQFSGSVTGASPFTIIADGEFDEDGHLELTPVGDAGSPQLADHDAKSAARAQERRQWGTAKGVAVGSNNQYGEVQYTSEPAPGITVFGCSGHGGIKLSPERQRGMGALSVSGAMYEEDCESHLVAMRYPEAFHSPDADQPSREATLHRAEQGVRDYFPDQYEAHTGTKLAFGESLTRDGQAWREKHASDTAVWSASSNDDGTIDVSVSRVDRSGDTKVYRIPGDQYPERPSGDDTFGSYRPTQRLFTPGPDAVDITPPPKPPAQRHHPDISTAGLSSADERRMTKDLNQRWRGADGNARSLRDIISTEGLAGKSSFDQGNGRRKYGLKQGSSFLTVSKATFTSLDVPDESY